MPPPAERVRPSATVILTRRSPALEVFLVERSQRTRFFPGHHVFPGGVLEKEEGDGPDARRRAALRELAEETHLRVEDADRLVDAGTLVTPAFGPTRYDTTFYVLELRQGEEPLVDGAELVSGRWWQPADAIRAFEEAALAVPPPTLAYLRLLAQTGDPAAAAEAARATDGRPHHERFRIEFHPGVHVLPLRTPTLPPATTQDCYVLDSDPIVVIDPGARDKAEQAPLLHTLDELERRDREGLVLLTHHHADHVSAARAVAERYGFRVLASKETRDALPAGTVDGVVADGHVFDLGPWRGRPWRLEVLATPGHTPGHLAFRDQRWGAVFAGDLVSGVSTILIDPDEGDMGRYMASLERCAALKPPIVLPGHGPALPGAAFERTLDHRRMREGKTLAALGPEPRTVEALLPRVYDDTPVEAWGLAARSLEAHLRHLERKGRAQRRDEGWAVPSP